MFQMWAQTSCSFICIKASLDHVFCCGTLRDQACRVQHQASVADRCSITLCGVKAATQSVQPLACRMRHLSMYCIRDAGRVVKVPCSVTTRPSSQTNRGSFRNPLTTSFAHGGAVKAGHALVQGAPHAQHLLRLGSPRHHLMNHPGNLLLCSPTRASTLKTAKPTHRA